MLIIDFKVTHLNFSLTVVMADQVNCDATLHKSGLACKLPLSQSENDSNRFARDDNILADKQTRNMKPAEICGE